MIEFPYKDIIEKFNVKGTLGQGSQKVVFAVEHPEHGSCVLKIGLVKNPPSLERINREVNTLRSINSEYYPRQFALEMVDDRRFYILEERLNGTPLSEQLGNFPTVPAATHLVLQIVDGLIILWERRIIHRDIKPANIIVTPSGRPKIIDLGIARLIDLDSLTHSLAPLGPCTPNHAAPEQLQNRKHEINHRADQYCLGILYGQLLLGGTHPFDPDVVGAGQSVVENIMSDRWARQRFESLPQNNAIIVLSRMLAPEPHGRYRVPTALREALSELI